MPNHITNQFHYVSDAEKFRQYAMNDKDEIDFHILLPMPELLNIVSGNSGRDIEPFDYPKITEHDSVDVFIQKCVDGGQSVTKAIAYWNAKKYGYSDWYSWRIDKWGTKWNAYEIDMESKSFQTAWSVPVPWLVELAKHIDFALYYADEDIGSNCGIIEAKEGHIYHILPDSNAEAVAWAHYVIEGGETAINLDDYGDDSKFINILREAKANFWIYHDNMVNQLSNNS